MSVRIPAVLLALVLGLVTTLEGRSTTAVGALDSIETYAGGGVADDVNATESVLNRAEGVVVDGSGNAYVADTKNCRIRKVTPAGDIYFADTHNCVVRKITGGIVSHVAGDGECDDSAGSFDSPSALALDGNGNVYVADTLNCQVRKATPAGTISVVAGTGTCGFDSETGAATSVKLNYPSGIAVIDSDVYVADTENCLVRKIDSSGDISTAGGVTSGGAVSCGSGAGQLNRPAGISADGTGNLFVADQSSGRLLKLSAGTLTTVSASVSSPTATLPISISGTAYVYVAELGCNVERVRVSDGAITTVVGGGCGYSGDGGPAEGATLRQPHGLASTCEGNLLIADTNNSRIRIAYTGSDGDCDTVSIASDNCGGVSNASQTNSDKLIDIPGKVFDDVTLAKSDGLGDACDVDADNDSLLDSVETAGAPCASASGATSATTQDTDGDRALDGAECALGSDPNDIGDVPSVGGTDTDGDHLSDTFEEGIGSNPSAADTDGDGLTDGIEVIYYNTNPLLTNSDGDQCSDGKEVATFNADYNVSAIDLGIQAQHMNTSAGDAEYITDFDTNKDGTINSTDQNWVASMLGAC